MTRVSIELDSRQDFRHPLPVELRRIDLALIGRGVSTQQFDLDEGSYFVTSTLPNGLKLFGHAKVTGPEATILLSVDPDSVDISAVDSLSEYEIGPLKRDHPFIGIRQFTGNVMTGKYVDESRKLNRRRGSKVIHPPGFNPRAFDVTGTDSTTVIQLLKPGIPPLNILIPAHSGEGCQVLFRITRGGQLRFAIKLWDPIADLLFQYLRVGYLQEAATLLQSERLVVTDQDRVRGWSNLFIKLYTLLRLGELDRLAEFVDESRHWAFDSEFPDESAIRGEVLARLGRHEEALEAFMELASRGIPIFADGLSYATHRLEIYRLFHRGSLKKEIEALTVLRRLERFATYQTSTYPILAYTGLKIDEPDATPYSGDTAQVVDDDFDVAEVTSFWEAEQETSLFPPDSEDVSYSRDIMPAADDDADIVEGPSIWDLDHEIPSLFPPVSKGAAIGLDFGNTNSSVVVKDMETGAFVIVSDAEGNRRMPSVVAFGKEGEQLIGYAAKRQAVLQPRNTIHSVKRLLGRGYDEVSKNLANLSYDIVRLPNDRVGIRAKEKIWLPEEIAATVLRHFKELAQDYLGEKVHRAVITVPASFDSVQRQAIKDAASIAGLNEVNLLNEPSAAALYFDLNRPDPPERRIVAVLNFGGGAFDVSVLKSGREQMEVISTDGDAFLGGDDIDAIIGDWIRRQFLEREGIDLSSDSRAMQRLREAAERAKVELSTLPETEINLAFISADETGPKHLVLRLPRKTFEELIEPIVIRLLPPLTRALKAARIDIHDIDEVLLVGGSVRIPRVQAIARSFFTEESIVGINPNEAIAFGAAWQANLIDSKRVDAVLRDVLPLSLGIETLGGVFTRIIQRNTPLPTSKSETFSTADDNQNSVEVHVLQGERPIAADNRSLGKFVLSGIMPMPRGVPQIEVTFNIDANGMITVSAKDRDTGLDQEITLAGSWGLSAAEVQHLLSEAESHSGSDKQKLEETEFRLRLSSAISNCADANRWLSLSEMRSKRSNARVFASIPSVPAAFSAPAIADSAERMVVGSKTLRSAASLFLI